MLKCPDMLYYIVTCKVSSGTQTQVLQRRFRSGKWTYITLSDSQLCWDKGLGSFKHDTTQIPLVWIEHSFGNWARGPHIQIYKHRVPSGFRESNSMIFP